MDFTNINTMSGNEFEDFIICLFEDMGYTVEKTPKNGDYGADMILHIFNQRIAVQVKHSKNAIGVGAIQEVYASMRFYNTDAACVLTSNFYTEQARLLGEANNVLLWDRDSLYSFVNMYNMSRSPFEKILTNQFKNIAPPIHSVRNMLIKFLRDAALFAVRQDLCNVENTPIRLMEPTDNLAKTYGTTHKKPACIYGRRLILIKVEVIYQTLGYEKAKLMELTDLKRAIQDDFQMSLHHPNDGLVLAPQQYRANTGRYTAFNKEKLEELVSEWKNVKWK